MIGGEFDDASAGHEVRIWRLFRRHAKYANHLFQADPHFYIAKFEITPQFAFSRCAAVKSRYLGNDPVLARRFDTNAKAPVFG